MFGGWNPIKDVSNAVSNVAKEVSKGVDNVVKETGRGLENTRNFVESGDIGKVVKTAAAPIAAGFDVPLALVRGDFQRAGGQTASAILNNNPVSQTINATNFTRDLANSDFANNITFGWSRDAVKATEAHNRIATGRVTESDLSDMARYNVRSVAYATAGAAALNTGAASKATSWATSNPTQALIAGKMISEGNAEGAGQGILNQILPGAGDIIKEILNPTPTPTISPTGQVVAGYNKTQTLLAIGGVTVVLLAGFLIAKRG